MRRAIQVSAILFLLAIIAGIVRSQAGSGQSPALGSTYTGTPPIVVSGSAISCPTCGTGTGDALTSQPLSQFASTTSAQFAGVISNGTGTGAVVFGTSPSLTTPNLGTPSAAVLTNATGLPRAAITGTTSNNLQKGSGGALADSTISDGGSGVQVGSPTGGAEGAGTINAAGNIYQQGVQVQSTANVGPGCQTGCSYPVGVGYYTPIPFGSVTTLMTANNTPQFIKFYNQSLQKLGNATIRVVTASAGGHASIAVYSIGATTITQIWTTGQQSTATGNTNIAVTPSAVFLQPNTSYYIGWCADNTTATLAGVTNGGQAGSMGATGAANSYGIDATDVCTNGTMPSSATIANIANNVNASIAGIWGTN
jgi:hypothetical protein